jgi:hypothetical protein
VISSGSADSRLGSDGERDDENDDFGLGVVTPTCIVPPSLAGHYAE